MPGIFDNVLQKLQVNKFLQELADPSDFWARQMFRHPLSCSQAGQLNVLDSVVLVRKPQIQEWIRKRTQDSRVTAGRSL